jgi:hypothetical protein
LSDIEPLKKYLVVSGGSFLEIYRVEMLFERLVAQGALCIRGYFTAGINAHGNQPVFCKPKKTTSPLFSWVNRAGYVRYVELVPGNRIAHKNPARPHSAHPQ